MQMTRKVWTTSGYFHFWSRNCLSRHQATQSSDQKMLSVFGSKRMCGKLDIPLFSNEGQGPEEGIRMEDQSWYQKKKSFYSPDNAYNLCSFKTKPLSSQFRLAWKQTRVTAILSFAECTSRVDQRGLGYPLGRAKIQLGRQEGVSKRCCDKLSVREWRWKLELVFRPSGLFCVGRLSPSFLRPDSCEDESSTLLNSFSWY